jgi:hypothetical protein
VSVSRCVCHDQPVRWCPGIAVGPGMTLAEERPVGVMVWADWEGECGICGFDYGPGAQVVALPAPEWAHPYAHLVCPVP